MPEYRFTPEAREDLQSIIDYTLGSWGQGQAHKYIDGLEALAGKLAKKPHIGVNCDALIPGLISFPYASHVLYYVPQRRGITIIRVLHNAMDARKHL